MAQGFSPGIDYSRPINLFGWVVPGGNDPAPFLLADTGAALLIWRCHGAWRGRWQAALIGDYSGMGNRSRQPKKATEEEWLNPEQQAVGIPSPGARFRQVRRGAVETIRLKQRFCGVCGRDSRGRERHAICKVTLERKETALKETTMTLNLTSRLTIRIRKATDNASHVVRTRTRRLSITSMSFLKMEVLVFKYNVK